MGIEIFQISRSLPASIQPYKPSVPGWCRRDSPVCCPH